MLTALALAGCGGTHTQPTRSTRAATVGVNLNATPTSGAAVVANETPNVVTVTPPPTLRGAARVAFQRGEVVVEESGCLACHVIGANGNNGPGPELTHIGARLSRVEITRMLLDPTAPMPSFKGLPKPKLHELTAFLADLH